MVTMAPLADYLVRRLLTERGSQRMYRRTLDVPDDPGASQRLASIDHALRAAALALTEDRTEADTRSLTEEVARLKRARLAARKKAGAGAVERMAYVGHGQTGLEPVRRRRPATRCPRRPDRDPEISKPTIAGGQFHSNRVELTWSTNRKPIVPEAISVGPIHRRMRERHPWISTQGGLPTRRQQRVTHQGGIKRGQITQRKVHRTHPSLERASVIAFLRDRSPA